MAGNDHAASPRTATPDGRNMHQQRLAVRKAMLRKGLLAARANLSVSDRQAAGLVYALWKRGSYVLLPVLLPDNDLDWSSYEGPDSLKPGPYGLLEPSEPSRGTGAIRSADLVIVPALAADRRGNRLGRGGGCYDRALSKVGPGVPTVALLYDDELLDEIPAGPLDQRVRAVAQPTRGITRLV